MYFHSQSGIFAAETFELKSIDLHFETIELPCSCHFLSSMKSLIFKSERMLIKYTLTNILWQNTLISPQNDLPQGL